LVGAQKIELTLIVDRLMRPWGSRRVGAEDASARSGRSNVSAPSHDLPKTTPASSALACENPGFNEIECAKNIRN
jgi:hypothetical protein